MFDESPKDSVLAGCMQRFDADRSQAARAYWQELRGGIVEKLAETSA